MPAQTIIYPGTPVAISWDKKRFVPSFYQRSPKPIVGRCCQQVTGMGAGNNWIVINVDAQGTVTMSDNSYTFVVSKEQYKAGYKTLTKSVDAFAKKTFNLKMPVLNDN